MNQYQNQIRASRTSGEKKAVEGDGKIRRLGVTTGAPAAGIEDAHLKDDELIAIMRLGQRDLSNKGTLEEQQKRADQLEQEKKEREMNWPLYLIPGFREERIVDEKLSPLSALAVVAWMRVARRHVELLRLAEQWRKETQLLSYCETCGVHGNDPNANDPVNSLWAPIGPKLRIYEFQDMHNLVKQFEEK